ncbi:MAG: hypothetical protein ACI9DK_001656 [Vicingaceae bacterium]|jgi:hypothetical protein
MIMKKTVLSYTLFLFCLSAIGQLKPIGTWTDHLPLNQGTSITSDGTKIYAATTTGFFTLNIEDNSLAKFTKVNLLNDVEISQIAYSDESKTLIIVYDNANIDLISNNTVTNIPFIKLSREKKDINSITIIGKLAYLSMAYGITVVNLERQEIVDTYKFGSNGTEINVTSVGVFHNNIYAGTNSGIYKASNNSNLLDFNSWSKLPEKNNSVIKAVWSNYNTLNFIFKQGSAKDSLLQFDGASFAINEDLSAFDFASMSQTTGNKFILNTKDSTYIFENTTTTARFAKNNINVLGSALIGDRLFDINQFTPLVEVSTTNGSTVQGIKPNGPQIANIFDLDAEGGNLWITNGAIDGTYNNRFDLAKLSHFDGTNWSNYSHGQDLGIDDIFDLVSVTINPDNSNEVFFGSWGRGIAHFPGRTPFKIYQDTNTLYTNNFGQLTSAVQQREAWTAGLWVGTGESAFDKDGNLWMTNTYQKNGLLVRLANGSWFSYNLGNLYSSNETAMFDIEIDDNGYKWLAMAKDNDIIVYDDNGTIKDITDDRSVRLTRNEGLGSIPGQRGIKIEKDNDGLIWIGTSDGIAVHFNPAGVFNGDYDFDRIIFFDGENNEVVLQNSIVTEIAIDGFNRKWIGTENSGVILLSADGKETILEFNEDNSPLLSNTISAIAVDDESGEVYIATSKGLVSYRAEAISGAANLTDITIYPNPVRPEYTGSIAISGLLDQSTVKITDVHGTLINELKSEGGQVLWDGNNFKGRRASTGVYLLFVSGNDPNQILRTEVGKILFVN